MCNTVERCFWQTLRGIKGQAVPLLFCDRVSGLGQRVGGICLDLEWIKYTIKFLSHP